METARRLIKIIFFLDTIIPVVLEFLRLVQYRIAGRVRGSGEFIGLSLD